MKKWMKFLSTMAFIVCLATAVKVDARAAEKLTGIRQIDASTEKITVEVDSNLQTKYYKLELKEVGSDTWVNMGHSSSPTNLYTSEAKLTPGTSYMARVRGFDDYKLTTPTTEYSDEIEVVTCPSVSNMEVVQAGAAKDSFTVQFSEIKGANYYFLKYNDEILATSQKAELKTPKTLKSGTEYRVNAYAARKSSMGFIAYNTYQSAHRTFKTLTGAMGAKNFGISDVYANINVYYFRISVLQSYDGTQLQFATPNGKVKKTIDGSDNYRISGFINGNFFKYRVRTYVNCGTKRAYSAWSGYKYIGMPKKINFRSIGKYNSKYTAVKIDWDKVANASGYTVYISKGANAGYKKVKTVGPKTRSLTVTKYGKSKLNRNTKYYIKIVTQAKVGKKTVSSAAYWYTSV